MRPGVGFNPQMPQKCAGSRIDPPPSLPTPPAESPAAIAAASPPLDPPAVRVEIPGIVGAAIKKIVGLPGHQQFGRISDAKNYSSGRAQTRHERRIHSGDVSSAQTRTSFAAMSGNINRRLYGNGDTMQRPKFVFVSILAQNRLLCVPRLSQHSLRLAIDERVQLGIDALDAIEVSLRHFHRRNFSAANLRRDFTRRRKSAKGHAL